MAGHSGGIGVEKIMGEHLVVVEAFGEVASRLRWVENMLEGLN